MCVESIDMSSSCAHSKASCSELYLFDQVLHMSDMHICAMAYTLLLAVVLVPLRMRHNAARGTIIADDF